MRISGFPLPVLAVILPWPAAAGTLTLDVSVDGVKATALTGAVLGIFGDDGMLDATCSPAGKSALVSGGESHWLSDGSGSGWACTLDGTLDASSVFVLQSDEHSFAWTSEQDSSTTLLLTTPGGRSKGLVHFDVDGSEPLFMEKVVTPDTGAPVWFDIDGSEPIFLDEDLVDFDLDGSEPIFIKVGLVGFDIDGTEPVFLDPAGGRTWIALAAATLSAL